MSKEFKVGRMYRVPKNFEIKEHRNHWVRLVAISPSGTLTMDNLGRRFDCTKDDISAQRGLTVTARWEILDRDRFRCRVCGQGAKHGVTLQVDHAKSFYHGGATDSLENLWTLCSDCNAGKSARSVEKITAHPRVSMTQLKKTKEVLSQMLSDISVTDRVDPIELLELLNFIGNAIKEFEEREE
jgi:hypothetical protein